jgi:hypothetical protein
MFVDWGLLKEKGLVEEVWISVNEVSIIIAICPEPR